MRNVVYSSLTALLIGMIAVDINGMFSGFWVLMGSGPVHIAAMVVMLVVTGMLWLVKPPRPMAVRVALGTLGIVGAVVMVQQTLAYHLGMIDALVGMTMVIVLIVEALESTAQHRQSMTTSLGTARP